MKTSKLFNVVITANLAYQPKSAMLSGIMSYVKTHTSWNITLLTGRLEEPTQFNADEVDGVIIDFINNKMPRWMRDFDFRKPPMILNTNRVGSAFACYPGCRIYCDNAPIAATAAKHLLSKQCEAYAFVHSAGCAWSDERGKLFSKAVKDDGRRFLWRTSDRRLLPSLIANAPKPLGIFAATDILARTTLDACKLAGCRVPDDVLVLGVDNDVTLCEISNPTISSIGLDMYDAGYRAAETLDRAMRGEIDIGEAEDIHFTGDTVVERLSTAHSFAYDMLVHRIMELLAEEFASPIRISCLATRFRVSRRTLETHFRAITGTTIAEEVCRLRIERAKHLLATTTKSQEKIATACGFYNASHLSATFRSRLGMRPSAFRCQTKA